MRQMFTLSSEVNNRFLTPTACLFPRPIIATVGVMRSGVRHGVLAVDNNQAFEIIGRQNTRPNFLSGCKKKGRVNTCTVEVRISSPINVHRDGRCNRKHGKKNTVGNPKWASGRN